MMTLRIEQSSKQDVGMAREREQKRRDPGGKRECERKRKKGDSQGRRAFLAMAFCQKSDDGLYTPNASRRDPPHLGAGL
jgi:hypothetical protein